MSEYANIEIKNMSLFGFRNYLQDDIVRLFFSKRDYVCISDYIDDPDDEDSKKYSPSSGTANVTYHFPDFPIE